MALDLETREQLIDTVRRFVAERLRPIEAKVAEDDAVPAEIVEEMKGLGLFGLSIPEDFGGLGLNITAWSYLGQMNLSFLSGRRTIPDLWPLVGMVEEEFAALRAEAERRAAAHSG